MGTCSKENLGKVLTNGTGDFGLFQINKAHIKEAKNMGLDIMTEAGNTAFAIYLYQQNGTRDWNSSKSCWQKLAERDS